MPLPAGGNDYPWPPHELKPMLDVYRRWSAWYTGNPGRLVDAYQNWLGTDVASSYDARPQPSAHNLMRERRFWGTVSIGDGEFRPARLHIPLASDIASMSADLLLGEMPAVRCIDETAKPVDGQAPEPHEATQQRLDEIIEDEGIQAKLLEGLEIAAAYGSTYFRIGWDREVAEHPFTGAIAPDRAVPDWRSGRLNAVTFWRNLPRINDRDEGKQWRHLERHERGVIMHGLYLGAGDMLGDPMPLEAHPETRVWSGMATRHGIIETRCKWLTAEYVPNMLPMREIPGSPFGRSDYEGIDGLLDAVDETWTSWMRDMRLGKARLIVPDLYLKNKGTGKGSSYDPEQEIYQTISTLPQPEGLTIESVQFKIRTAEHQATSDALLAAALRGAGYSIQMFGDPGAGGAQKTATEVTSREARGYKTQERKRGYLKAPLRRLLGTLLEADIAQFGPDGVLPIRPRIEFPEPAAQDPKAVAETVQLLSAANAISQKTAIQMVNPDWRGDQVDEEVDRIREDAMAMLPPVPPPGQASITTGGTKPGQPGAAKPKPPAGGAKPSPPAGKPRPPSGGAKPARKAA